MNEEDNMDSERLRPVENVNVPSEGEISFEEAVDDTGHHLRREMNELTAEEHLDIGSKKLQDVLTMHASDNRKIMDRESDDDKRHQIRSDAAEMEKFSQEIDANDEEELKGIREREKAQQDLAELREGMNYDWETGTYRGNAVRDEAESSVGDEDGSPESGEGDTSGYPESSEPPETPDDNSDGGNEPPEEPGDPENNEGGFGNLGFRELNARILSINEDAPREEVSELLAERRARYREAERTGVLDELRTQSRQIIRTREGVEAETEIRRLASEMEAAAREIDPDYVDSGREGLVSAAALGVVSRLRYLRYANSPDIRVRDNISDASLARMRKDSSRRHFMSGVIEREQMGSEIPEAQVAPVEVDVPSPKDYAMAMTDAWKSAYREVLSYSEDKAYTDWMNVEENNSSRTQRISEGVRPEFWKNLTEQEQEIMNIRRELNDLCYAKRTVGYSLENYSGMEQVGNIQTREVVMLYENMPGFREGLEEYADIFLTLEGGQVPRRNQIFVGRGTNEWRNVREISQEPDATRFRNKVRQRLIRPVFNQQDWDGEIQTRIDTYEKTLARLRNGEYEDVRADLNERIGALRGIDRDQLKMSVALKLREDLVRQRDNPIEMVVNQEPVDDTELANMGIDEALAEEMYQQVWRKAREAEQASFNALYGLNAFESWMFRWQNPEHIGDGGLGEGSWGDQNMLDMTIYKTQYLGRFVSAALLEEDYPLITALNKVDRGRGELHGKHGPWILEQAKRLKGRDDLMGDDGVVDVIRVVDVNENTFPRGNRKEKDWKKAIEAEARANYWLLRQETIDTPQGPRQMSVLQVPEVYPRRIIESPWERNRIGGKSLTQHLLDKDEIAWGSAPPGDERDEFSSKYGRDCGKASIISSSYLDVPISKPAVGEYWQKKTKAAFDKLSYLNTKTAARFMAHRKIYEKDNIPYLEGEMKSPIALEAFAGSRVSGAGLFSSEDDYYFPWDFADNDVVPEELKTPWWKQII